MTPFTIKSFPLPPSINAVYANHSSRGRIKTQVMHKYEDQVKAWCLKTGHALQSARVLISNLPHNYALHLDRHFYFKHDSILTKKNRPKRNDTTNRIKALDDALAAILGCDDSLFWSGSETKSCLSNEELDPYVDITISAIELDFDLVTRQD